MYVAAMRLEAKLLRMNGVTHLKLNPDDTRRGLVPRSCNRIEIELRWGLREKMHFFTAPPTTKPVLRHTIQEIFNRKMKIIRGRSDCTAT